MRQSHTCPKCSGTKLLVNAEVRVPEYHSSNVTGPIAALTLSEPGNPSNEGCSSSGRKLVGRLEAWICLGCGYTEHYAINLGTAEHLAKLVAQYPHALRIVDGGAT